MARIYVSSSYTDLAPAREEISRALRRTGHVVIAMEDYVAADERPLERCLADVAACDVYIGVFAWRYGYIPPQQTASITELEFLEARRLTKPMLLFLLHEDAPWPRSQVDRDGTSIERLRAAIGRDFLVSFFRTSAELATLVTAAVANLERAAEAPRAPTSDFLRTPHLGLELWQEGTRNPLLRAQEDTIRVPMRPVPFELRIPGVGTDDHVKIASAYDDSIFAYVRENTKYEQVPFFSGGTGLADTAYGLGALFVQERGHMYLDPGGRLVLREDGVGLFLFNTIWDSGGPAGFRRGSSVYLVVHLAHDGGLVTPYNTERLILAF